MPSLRPIYRGLRLRFARHGCANRPFYHIVAIDRHKARDFKPLEQVGTYDPLPNKDNEIMVALNFERIRFWLGKGAIPSKPLEQLFGLCGFLPIHPMSVMQAKRTQECKERKETVENWKVEKEKSEES